MNGLYQSILQAQSLYPRLFATRQDTPWGVLFDNPRNTLSVEANHGVLWEPYPDYEQALAETDAFFRQRELPARLYCYLPQAEAPALRDAMQTAGGTLTQSPLQLLLCRSPEEQTHPSPLTFEHLRQWDSAVNEYIIGENLHLEGLLRGSMQHPSYTLTVGRLMGTPVTMAGIWDSGPVMRISNVMTGEGFRGCGFALSLILHQLSLAAQAGKPAYLFADNPVAIRVYQRAGMVIEDPGFRLYLWEK